MRWHRLIATAAVPCLVVTGCGGTLPAKPATLSSVEWSLSFEEQFDGPAGSPPDPGVWRPDVGGTGWGNDERQYYTPGGNTFLDGTGNLVIEARRSSADLSCWYGACRYTSGKLTTKKSFAQEYGRFETRVKAPVGKGLWTAFWLLGDDIDEVGHPESGEIDVFETLGDATGEIEQHAHGPGLDFGEEYVLPAGQSFGDWHTYLIEWTADSIDWQVDGVTTRRLTRGEADDGWVFDHPFYMLLNFAVGGEWPGDPDADTQFPARLLVDYVRVYARRTAG